MVVKVPPAAEPSAAALPEAAELWTELCWLWTVALRANLALSLWFLKEKPSRVRLLPWMLAAPLLLIVQGALAAIPALQVWRCLMVVECFDTADPSEW